jgi:hypothetical protein
MRTLAFAFMAGLVLSCNNPAKETKPAAGSVTETPNYPYKIDKPDNWEIGSTANVMTALSSIKAWENQKIDESMSYFGDSVDMAFDGLNKKMPRDSVKAMLGGLWNIYKTARIDMRDWESVISKDKSEEWVTLWYTEHWETKAGVKDSAALINDIRLKNGKIVAMNEYTRKFH